MSIKGHPFECIWYLQNIFVRGLVFPLLFSSADTPRAWLWAHKSTQWKRQVSDVSNCTVQYQVQWSLEIFLFKYQLLSWNVKILISFCLDSSCQAYTKWILFLHLAEGPFPTPRNPPRGFSKQVRPRPSHLCSSRADSAFSAFLIRVMFSRGCDFQAQWIKIKNNERLICALEGAQRFFGCNCLEVWIAKQRLCPIALHPSGDKAFRSNEST